MIVRGEDHRGAVLVDLFEQREDVDRALGIEHLKPVGVEKLREMMIADGIDPNDNEFSRGIIEMREE